MRTTNRGKLFFILARSVSLVSQRFDATLAFFPLANTSWSRHYPSSSFSLSFISKALINFGNYVYARTERRALHSLRYSKDATHGRSKEEALEEARGLMRNDARANRQWNGAPTVNQNSL